MVVHIKKTSHHKRHSPNKHTKKMKGGALTQTQIDLLRILSKIITWGSLGFISICTAMPLIQIIMGLLSSVGIDSMSSSFYELIWVNLSSTMSSLYNAAGSAGVAAFHGLNVLSKAGNLCAAVHATVRLANPIYSFALGSMQHFIELMKNPLNFNQTINKFLSEQRGIIDNFMGDYYTVGRHARAGVQASAAAQKEIYEKMKLLLGNLANEIDAALPKRSAAEIAARDANLQSLKNCEDFVFSILSIGAEGFNYGSAKWSANKEKAYRCANGTMGYAKEWFSYFGECAGSTMQYINKRKRARTPSPKHSPPPSPKEIVELATTMMTNEDEESSQYEEAVESFPEAATAVIRAISPEPREIAAKVREFNACPRGVSEPPLGERPTLKARRTTIDGSKAIKPPNKEEVEQWQTIAESDEKPSSTKMKVEGGRKTRRRKKRRGTRRS